MTGNDPQLYFAEDGAPRSARFGDIYYSLQDGLAESRAVFLDGCGLPGGWSVGGTFSVLELGFGTGLNIVALMQLWAGNRPAGGHLHIFSIEGFLMPREAAQTALHNWPELATFSDAILAQWPKARRGFHYMDFPQWGISLTLALMDVTNALDAWSGPADAIFFDGFSPALNPDMWSESVFQRIAARSAPGARLATFTVAGFVRRGLQTVGFTVEKKPGFGRKRERLEAVLGTAQPRPVASAPRIAVVGAGIAGACLVYQARGLGFDVDLYDTEDGGGGASGNDSALVTPRLDAGDNAISALFADAHAYAVSLYRRITPHAFIAEGVYQCESDPRDAGRFDKIKDQACHAAHSLTHFKPGDLSTAAGASGLKLAEAIVITPATAIAGLLHGHLPIKQTVTEVVPHGDGRVVLKTGNDEHLYDAVVIACGAGIFDLGDIAATHALRPVRGQVEMAEGAPGLDCGVSWGGYAVPAPGGILFGATHDRDDRGVDIREIDRQRNIASLQQGLPQVADTIASVSLRSRASIRVTTRDYLPVAGATAPGLFVLTGLGARGFCLAPLLAKAILCEIVGAPSPLPSIAKNLLRPERLSTRASAYK